MAKKRKKVNKSFKRKQDNRPENNKALRIQYLKIIQKLCQYSGCGDVFKLLTKEEQIEVFVYRIYVDPVKMLPKEDCSNQVYKLFNHFVCSFSREYRSNVLPENEKYLTNFEALVGHHFLEAISTFIEERKLQLFIAFSPLQEYLGSKDDTIKHICFQYNFLCNSRNLFEHTTYALKLDLRIKSYPTPGICYDSILTSIASRPSDYIDKGKKRKVYQLGYLRADAVMEWVSIPVNKLQGKYKGLKKALPLCIQSHAYHRLFERLNPMKDLNVIWHLSNNLKDGIKIELYKELLLIPFFHRSHKCGYFVAVINQNRLILKTFLFLTHHSTPEGEKLEQISGLSKEEISYWKIDTLQNFIDADLGDDHKIMTYLKDAEISHLLNVDILLYNERDQNTYNWGALSSYIDNGKTELYNEGAEDNEDELLSELTYELEAQLE